VIRPHLRAEVAENGGNNVFADDSALCQANRSKPLERCDVVSGWVNRWSNRTDPMIPSVSNP
jgi:hypothetical protein